MITKMSDGLHVWLTSACCVWVIAVSLAIPVTGVHMTRNTLITFIVLPWSPQVTFWVSTILGKIFCKIEKSSKTGQEKKSFISTFACFLTAIANV